MRGKSPRWCDKLPFFTLDRVAESAENELYEIETQSQRGSKWFSAAIAVAATPHPNNAPHKTRQRLR